MLHVPEVVAQAGVTPWYSKGQQFQTLFLNFCFCTPQRASGQGAEMPRIGEAREGRCEIAAAWGWFCSSALLAPFASSRASGEETAWGMQIFRRFHVLPRTARDIWQALVLTGPEDTKRFRDSALAKCPLMQPSPVCIM